MSNSGSQKELSPKVVAFIIALVVVAVLIVGFIMIKPKHKTINDVNVRVLEKYDKGSEEYKAMVRGLIESGQIPPVPGIPAQPPSGAQETPNAPAR